METVILIEKKRNALTAIRDMHKRAAIAQMAELVDAPASGAGVLTDVEVRVLFWAPEPPLYTQVNSLFSDGFLLKITRSVDHGVYQRCPFYLPT